MSLAVETRTEQHNTKISPVPVQLQGIWLVILAAFLGHGQLAWQHLKLEVINGILNKIL